MVFTVAGIIPPSQQEEPVAVARPVRKQTPKGEERRKEILEATLRIMAREGMRGVRHRAIAAEANVPLAATTYYFEDLDELTTQAFCLFAEGEQVAVARLQGEARTAFELFASEDLESPAVRGRLRDAALALASDYIAYSCTERRDCRLIEHAFLDACLRNPELAAAWSETYKGYEKEISAFLRAWGGPHPEASATQFLATILYLQYDASASNQVDSDKVESTLHVVLSDAIGVTT